MMSGGESLERDCLSDFPRQTTIFCDFVGLSVASEGRLRREASDFLSNVFREVDG